MGTDRRPDERVEQACPHADPAVRQTEKTQVIDRVLRLAAEGRRAVPVDATSAHDDLYDARGLPR